MKSELFCSLIACWQDVKVKQWSTRRLVLAVLLACTVGGFGFVGTAKASLYNFSYQFGTGDILSGQFDGTISSGDSNVLEVSSVVNLLFNGSTGPSLTMLYSASELILGLAIPPLVSFDGSVLDIVLTDSSFSDGFSFTDATFPPPNNGVVGTGPSFGNLAEAFDQANWSLAAVASAPTPLPGPLMLLASGLGTLGLFSWRRKRKAQAVAA